jgi:hypothetical protein
MVTTSQVLAIGRNVVSGLGGAAVTFGVMSASQNADVASGFTHIFNGVQEISVGIGILAPIAMSVWASLRSSPKAQVMAAGALPGVTVVATPSLADAAAASGSAPGDVKSSANVKIVPKVT